MTKGFMEVFPELVLEQEVRALFEKVKVERVTTTRQKDLIRVYISCGRLIPKTVIFRVEEEIARQLFPNCNITIKIQEKFQLSAQYNLKSLLETYQEHFTGIKGMQPGGIQSVQISQYFLPG